MTIKELQDTLESRQKGLSYRLWKQAVLTGQLFGKHFPRKPEDASPELYFRKSIPMPDFLMKDLVKGMKHE